MTDVSGGQLQGVTSRLDRPIFIICMHRTGSTLLKNLIDAHPDVSMLSEETDISNPWRRGLCQVLTNGESGAGADPKELAQRILAGDFHGTFWQKRELARLGVSEERLAKVLADSDRSCGQVFGGILRMIGQINEVPRVGVKFPLHVSRVPTLVDWFPNCKLIFLTRDPRAMVASKILHPATVRRKREHQGVAFLIHMVTTLFFAVEFRWFCRSMRGYMQRYDALHITYEDLINHTRKRLEDICKFAELPHDEGHLSAVSHVGGQPSSHTGSVQRGISTQSLHRWRSTLSRTDRLMLHLICGREMRRTGYV